MLTTYATREWLTILAIGLMVGGSLLLIGWWWAALLAMAAMVGLLAFFRDPERRVPTQRGVIVSPADGRVSSVHTLDHYEPLDGPAVCIRVFLSVFNVHLNRSPCHARVASIEHRPGRHLSALRTDSAAANESNLLVLTHPTRRHRVAAVRQVAGLFARTIVCGVREGQILQRGQRFGMIKLGSTTELYLPLAIEPDIRVREGAKVRAGLTVLAHAGATAAPGEAEPAAAVGATVPPRGATSSPPGSRDEAVAPSETS